MSVPWLGSIFDIAPEHEEAVRQTVFETGKLPFYSPGAELSSEILAVADLADGSMLIAGIAEGQSTVTVESGAGSARLPFSVRRLVDELAFTHPAGLTFVIPIPP